VNNTSLHHISYRLPDTVQYWSNYRVLQGVPV